MDQTLLDALLQELAALRVGAESLAVEGLTLKAWSVTVTAAALVAACLARPVDRAGRGVVLMAALVAVPFWIADAHARLLQIAQAARLDEIGALLTRCLGGGADLAECDPAALGGALQTEIAGGPDSVVVPPLAYLTELGDAMTDPAVWPAHAAILAIGLVAAALAAPRAEAELRQPTRRGARWR